MKKLIALSVGLLSTAAFAQDFLDLNYFTPKNNFEYTTQYSHSKVDYRIHDDAGNVSSLVKINGDIFSNKLTYGLTEKLRLGLGMDIAVEGEAEKEKYHGPSDMKAIAEYRLFTDGEYFIDANGGYQLSTERQTNHNYRDGHDILNIGASMGQKKNNHEWRMRGDLNYHFWGKNNGVKNNPYANFDLITKYQYRGIENFALGLGMDWEYLGEKTTRASGVKQVTDTDSILAFSAFAKYALNKSANLEAGYRIQMRYELDSELGPNKETAKFREGSTCYVGAKLKF